jgi:chaperonin cofactor prefoldin
VSSSVSSYITPKIKSKLLESLEEQEIKISNIATTIENHHDDIEEYIKNTQQKIQFR